MVVRVTIYRLKKQMAPRVEIRNRAMTIRYDHELTEDIRQALGRNERAYFRAHLDLDGRIVLDRQIRWRGW